jgi:hypothetical protein
MLSGSKYFVVTAFPWKLHWPAGCIGCRCSGQMW